MMWKIFLILIEIFTLLCQRIFAQSVLNEKKVKMGMKYLGWSGYFVVANYFTHILSKNEWVNIIIIMLSFFVLLRVLYEDSEKTLATVTVFMVVGGVLSEFLTYYGWTLVTGRDVEDLNISGQYMLILISRVLMFFFIKLSLMFIKRHNHAELRGTEWIEVFMIPGGSIIILTALFYRQGQLGDILDFVSIFMIMLINLFTFNLYEKIRQAAERKIREEVLRDQMEYYVRQYKESSIMWSELSEFRHNIVERYLVGQTLAEQKNYDGLKDFFANSLEKLLGGRKISNTGNIYFDSIINYKSAIAEQDQIFIQTDLWIPADAEIEAEELCICLGNLLDNAIEASRTLTEDRVIDLKIKVDGKNMIMVVSNNYTEARKREGTRYLTTKSKKEEHGLGLDIVRKIARKHDGEVMIEDTGSNFTVTVLLYGAIL